MCHRNAPLTATGRMRLAWCIVEDGWPLRRAAERFQVSHTTANRWADRYRFQGWRGMYDPSSRPHPSPGRTPAGVGEQVVRLRQEHRIGPQRIAVRSHIAASTVHRILRDHHLPPPATLDRATGRPIRRYERDRPGERLHIDVMKLGRTANGGGHPVLERAAGRKNRDRAQLAFLHTAVDDHSRLAYTEDLPDEKAATCAGYLLRAAAWFAGHGITVERILTVNAWAYTKTTWHETCRQLGIQPRWTRPWRPQTNGKVERFHHTLLDEWAYHQPYTSDTERQAAFTDWLDWYNYHRPPRPRPLQGMGRIRSRGWLSNIAFSTPEHLIQRIRSGLRHFQYRSDLIDGCLAGIGRTIRPA